MAHASHLTFVKTLFPPPIGTWPKAECRHHLDSPKESSKSPPITPLLYVVSRLGFQLALIRVSRNDGLGTTTTARVRSLCAIDGDREERKKTCREKEFVGLNKKRGLPERPGLWPWRRSQASLHSSRYPSSPLSVRMATAPLDPNATVPNPSSGVFYEDRTATLYGGTIALQTLSTLFVILRFTSRRVSGKGFWWDDWMILPALVCECPAQDHSSVWNSLASRGLS